MTDEEINMIIKLVKERNINVDDIKNKLPTHKRNIGRRKTSALRLEVPENRKNYNDTYYSKNYDKIKQHQLEAYHKKQDENRLFPKWFIKTNHF